MSTIKVGDKFLNYGQETCTIIAIESKDKITFKHRKGNIYTTTEDVIKQHWTKSCRGNYKVGDFVRIKPKLEVGKRYGMVSTEPTVLCTYSMSKYIGKIAKITNSTNYYRIDVDSKDYRWVDGMFEDIEIQPDSHWERLKEDTLTNAPKGEIITVVKYANDEVYFNKDRSLSLEIFLTKFKPRPDLDDSSTIIEEIQTITEPIVEEPYMIDKSKLVDNIVVFCNTYEKAFAITSQFRSKAAIAKHHYETLGDKTAIQIEDGDWWITDSVEKNFKLVQFEYLLLTSNTTTIEPINYTIDKSKLVTDTVIHCDTYEKALAIIQQVDECHKNYSLEHWKIHNAETCIKICNYNDWRYCSIDYYKDKNVKILSFEEVLLTNKATQLESINVVDTNLQPTTKTIKKENTLMAKLKETTTQTIEQNKQALVIASKMEAGRIINKQVLKQLTPHLPFFVQGYTKSPFAPFVAANLVAMVANHTQNQKLQKVADLMVLGAADSGVTAFNLDKIIDDILANIKLPAGFSFDEDEDARNA